MRSCCHADRASRWAGTRGCHWLAVKQAGCLQVGQLENVSVLFLFCFPQPALLTLCPPGTFPLPRQAFLVDTDKSRIEFVGNRTECALLVMGRNWGQDYKALRDLHHDKIVGAWVERGLGGGWAAGLPQGTSAFQAPFLPVHLGWRRAQAMLSW